MRRLLLLAVLMLTIVILPASAKTFKVVIHNPNGYALTDYQVRIDLSGYLSSPTYLKVTDSSGKLLKFTYEQPNGECGVNPTTVIWVKVPYIPANGDTTIYVETSNTNYAVKGDDVFVFYDDFNEGFKHWNYDPEYTSLGNGVACIRGAPGCYVAMNSKITLSTPLTLESRLKYVSCSTNYNPGWDILLPTSHAGIRECKQLSWYGYLVALFCDNSNALRFWRKDGFDYIREKAISYPYKYLDGYHIFKIKVSPDWHISVYIDDELVATHDGYNYGKLTGHIAWREGSVNIDWIRVRKYADIEPTVTIEAQAPPSTPRPELSVDIQCDTIMKAGEIRTVNVIVKNIGTDTARNVDVKVSSEGLGVNIEKTFDEIPAGESRLVSFRISPDNAGEYKISAVASYWDSQGNKYIETAEQMITVQPVSAPLEKKEERGPGFEVITAVTALTIVLLVRKLRQ